MSIARLDAMTQRLLRTLLILCTLTSAASYAQDAMPVMSGRTLSGTPVTLPGDAHGRPLVLVFGFAKSAKDQSTLWGKELLSWQQQGLSFEFYQVAMLSGAPAFTHGLIVHAMKNSVPEAIRPHTLVLSSKEEPWTQLIRPENNNDVYVLLYSERGDLLWRTAGANSSNMLALRERLK